MSGSVRGDHDDRQRDGQGRRFRKPRRDVADPVGTGRDDRRACPLTCGRTWPRSCVLAFGPCLRDTLGVLQPFAAYATCVTDLTTWAQSPPVRSSSAPIGSKISVIAVT
jgi:hypothetical protein